MRRLTLTWLCAAALFATANTANADPIRWSLADGLAWETSLEAALGGEDARLRQTRILGPEGTRTVDPTEALGVRADFPGLTVRRLTYGTPELAQARAQQMMADLADPKVDDDVAIRYENAPVVIDTNGRDVVIMEGPRVGQDVAVDGAVHDAALEGQNTVARRLTEDSQAIAVFDAADADGSRNFAIELDDTAGPAQEIVNRAQADAADAEANRTADVSRLTDDSFQQINPDGAMTVVSESPNGETSILVAEDAQSAARLDAAARAHADRPIVHLGDTADGEPVFAVLGERTGSEQAQARVGSATGEAYDAQTHGAILDPTNDLSVLPLPEGLTPSERDAMSRAAQGRSRDQADVASAADGQTEGADTQTAIGAADEVDVLSEANADDAQTVASIRDEDVDDASADEAAALSETDADDAQSVASVRDDDTDSQSTAPEGDEGDALSEANADDAQATASAEALENANRGGIAALENALDPEAASRQQTVTVPTPEETEIAEEQGTEIVPSAPETTEIVPSAEEITEIVPSAPETTEIVEDTESIDRNQTTGLPSTLGDDQTASSDLGSDQGSDQGADVDQTRHADVLADAKPIAEETADDAEKPADDGSDAADALEIPSDQTASDAARRDQTDPSAELRNQADRNQAGTITDAMADTPISESTADAIKGGKGPEILEPETTTAGPGPVIEEPTDPEEIARIRAAADEHAERVETSRDEQIETLRRFLEGEKDAIEKTQAELAAAEARNAELVARTAELERQAETRASNYGFDDVYSGNDPYSHIPSRPEADRSGNRVYRDYNGNRVDPYGNRVDPYGNRIDDYGNRVDPYGRAVDGYGNPVRYDRYGNQTDRYGNPVDRYGDPVRYDRYGNPVDRYGNPADDGRGGRTRDMLKNLWDQGREAYSNRNNGTSSNREALLARIRELEEGNAELRRLIEARNAGLTANRDATLAATDPRYHPYVNNTFNAALHSRGVLGWDPSTLTLRSTGNAMVGTTVKAPTATPVNGTPITTGAPVTNGTPIATSSPVVTPNNPAPTNSTTIVIPNNSTTATITPTTITPGN